MGKVKIITNENLELISRLDTKYDEIISKVVCYIKAELNSIHSEFAINDICKAINEAYEKGEDLFEVIGDYTSFCESFIKRYKGSNKGYKVKSLVYDYMPVGFFAILLFIIGDMINTVYKEGAMGLENIIKINYPLKPALYLGVLISFLILMNSIKSITKASIMSSNSRNKVIIKNVVLVILFGGISIGLGLIITKIGVFNIVKFTVLKSAIALLICTLIILIYSMVSKSKLSQSF